MLEAQNLHEEAVKVYSKVDSLINEQVQGLCGGYAAEEVQDDDSQEIIDLKRSRGLILQKLGKIY